MSPASTESYRWRKPPFIANPVLRYGIWLAVAAYLVWALSSIPIDPQRIVAGFPRAAQIFGGAIPPDFARWELLLSGFLESIQIALIATAVGVVLAWAYSMPPIRLKQNGWWGNTAVGISYEGLAWFTGAAAMLSALPGGPVLVMAGLYSLGAHGIMTLNDFKAVEGDKRMGVKSLPVQLGVDNAARLACWVMAVPQAVVVVLLLAWDRPYHAAAIVLLLAFQATLMPSLLEQPKERAPWYNATGTSLYVIGMLVAAFAVRDLPSLTG